MKIKINRLLSFTTALVLALSALAVYTPSRALAAAKTWDGGGGDNNWNTAANWNGDAVPQAGDTVTFPDSSPVDSRTINVNVSISLAGITFSGIYSTEAGYELSGTGTLTLTGDISNTSDKYHTVDTNLTLGNDISVSGPLFLGDSESDRILELGAHELTFEAEDLEDVQCGVQVNSALKGSGDLVIGKSYVNLRKPKDTYTGAVLVSSGGISVFKDALGSGNTVTANGTSEVRLADSTGSTFGMNLVMNTTADPALSAYGFGYRCTGVDSDKVTTTLSGNLTLQKDTIFYGTNNLKVTGTVTKNGHSITTKAGSAGNLVLGTETIEAPEQTVTIEASDKQPGKSEFISNKQTYIIDGERGSVTVESGGVLKGTGTVGYIYSYSGAKLAPGHSPGAMTVLNSLNLSEGSEFEAEVLSKDAYDQFVVGEDFSGSNAVVLDDATLSLWIPEGFKISKDDTFTIIDNKHTSAVDGTFKDLPEGATFKAGGESDGVFKITYVGGDGNDVVLSVVTVPTVPSTGFFLGLSNPYVVLVAALATAGAAFYLTRRYAFATAKK